MELRTGICPSLFCIQRDIPEGEEFCPHCHTPLALDGKYRLLRVLGEGGMGHTYLAEDQRFLGTPNALCVIKELKHEFRDAKAGDLLRREAGRLLDLRHVGIPSYRDFFEIRAPSVPLRGFLVQQWIDGEDLDSCVRNYGPFPTHEAVGLMADALDVLRYLHGLIQLDTGKPAPLLHLDLKPQNLMLRRVDQQLFLIDFGVSSQIQMTMFATYGAKLSRGGFSLGFAPFEQTMGYVAPASDIYAWAMSLLVLMTGKHPPQLLDPITNTPMFGHYVKLSKPLMGLLLQCLSLQMKERPQRVEEVMGLLVRTEEYKAMEGKRKRGQTWMHSFAQRTGFVKFHKMSDPVRKAMPAGDSVALPQQFVHENSLRPEHLASGDIQQTPKGSAPPRSISLPSASASAPHLAAPSAPWRRTALPSAESLDSVASMRSMSQSSEPLPPPRPSRAIWWLALCLGIALGGGGVWISQLEWEVKPAVAPKNTMPHSPLHKGLSTRIEPRPQSTRPPSVPLPNEETKTDPPPMRSLSPENRTSPQPRMPIVSERRVAVVPVIPVTPRPSTPPQPRVLALQPNIPALRRATLRLTDESFATVSARISSANPQESLRGMQQLQRLPARLRACVAKKLVLQLLSHSLAVKRKAAQTLRLLRPKQIKRCGISTSFVAHSLGFQLYSSNPSSFLLEVARTLSQYRCHAKEACTSVRNSLPKVLNAALRRALEEAEQAICYCRNRR